MYDEVCIWIARMLPRRLVYWCALRIVAEYAHHRGIEADLTGLSVSDYLIAWEVESSGIFD